MTRNRRKQIRHALILVIVTMAGQVTSSARSDDQQRTPQKHRFADFGFLPEPGKYEGRIFRLSQAYPPDLSQERLPAFMKTDFRKDWRGYLLGARDYCFAGNISSDDVGDDFQVALSKPVQWFHMPWQHFGPNGREGIHGLTKEAPVHPQQLAWTQSSAGQTYAVGFYNRFGGYTIGKVWKSPERPNLHNIAFDPGTVIFKLLFVDIPINEVPSLKNPVVWQGYITDSFASSHRRVRDLALIQMDVMVRDEQSPHGWVFGTFQYNGALGKKNPWHNLVPVGLQWGNDPEAKGHHVNAQPITTLRNPALKETIVNDDDSELPATHLGWNGRLNGPVDNPMSSCFSCHAVAQVREKSPISPMFQDKPPVPGSKEWMRWFTNYRCTERFDSDVPTADFCLQLAISVQNFQKWQGELHGIHAHNYKYLSERARAKEAPTSPFNEAAIRNGKVEQVPKVQRDFPSP